MELIGNSWNSRCNDSIILVTNKLAFPFLNFLFLGLTRAMQNTDKHSAMVINASRHFLGYSSSSSAVFSVAASAATFSPEFSWTPCCFSDLVCSAVVSMGTSLLTLGVESFVLSAPRSAFFTLPESTRETSVEPSRMSFAIVISAVTRVVFKTMRGNLGEPTTVRTRNNRVCLRLAMNVEASCVMVL